jgi:hypothetical protein
VHHYLLEMWKTVSKRMTLCSADLIFLFLTIFVIFAILLAFVIIVVVDAVAIEVVMAIVVAIAVAGDSVAGEGTYVGSSRLYIVLIL